MLTKSTYCDAVREGIIARYSWAQSQQELDAFMARVAGTLNGTANAMSIDGVAFVEAWRKLGGKGRPTYNKLRKLPDRKPDPVTFRYSVGVYVEVEGGQVVGVRVDDECPIRDPELIEGDPRDLQAAVDAAMDGEAWPSWEIGL